jgi:hypothetical protein
MNPDIENSYEARDWLARNQSRSGFATNRFHGTQNARDFVEGLYAAGAVAVRIPLDSIRADATEIEEMGGPYADALFIELPDSGREEIYRIYEIEAEHEGYEGILASEALIDQRFLYLWWD